MIADSKQLKGLSKYDTNKKFSFGRTYIVRRGDTLSSIAYGEYANSNYWPYIWINNLNYSKLLKLDILSPLLLQPGDVILLPLKNDVLKWHSIVNSNFYIRFSNILFNLDLERIALMLNDKKTFNQVKMLDKKITDKTSTYGSEEIYETIDEKTNQEQKTQISPYPTISIEVNGETLSFPSFRAGEIGEINTNLIFGKGKISGRPYGNFKSDFELSLGYNHNLKNQ